MSQHKAPVLPRLFIDLGKRIGNGKAILLYHNETEIPMTWIISVNSKIYFFSLDGHTVQNETNNGYTIHDWLNPNLSDSLSESFLVACCLAGGDKPRTLPIGCVIRP